MMSLTFLSKINQRWKREYSFSFFVTIIIGLITHMFKFTNNLPNHDSIYNFHSNQNMVGSGRWFLSFACGFSSFYDLPWLIGLISLVFLALSVIVIIRIFRIHNKLLIVLINGMLVSYPSTTEIFCFEFTADGYMIAMFLSVLSVLVIIKGIENNRLIIPVILCSLLLCFSCGIYQAYISFALVLFICYFVWMILKYDNAQKEYLKYVLSVTVSLTIGLALYYLIWKTCLNFQGVQANDYQGISQVGALKLSDIISAPKSIAKTLLVFLLEKNIFKNGISLYALFNMAFLAFSVVTLVVAIIKSKAHKRMNRIIYIVISVIILPFAICIWRFVSPEVNYAPRMLQSVVLIFVFSLILGFEYLNINMFSLVYYFVAIAMIFNLTVQANIAYYYLNYEYENSYSEAVEINQALKSMLREQGEEHKIAIIGSRETEVGLEDFDKSDGLTLYTSMIERSLLTDKDKIQNYLQNVLYFNGEFADHDTIDRIKSTKEYANMTPFFDSGQIVMIDDVITVKLG